MNHEQTSKRAGQNHRGIAPDARCIHLLCDASGSYSIWARDNLHAWEIANWDLRKRTPDERARMLKKAGIRHYAYGKDLIKERVIGEIDPETWTYRHLFDRPSVPGFWAATGAVDAADGFWVGGVGADRLAFINVDVRKN